MRIAQWTTIGLAIVATSLSASGVLAVAYAKGQSNGEAARGNSCHNEYSQRGWAAGGKQLLAAPEGRGSDGFYP